MSVLTQIEAAGTVPLQDIFRGHCEIRTFLWTEHQIELQEAVDGLQAFAERTGLVSAIGQDQVQQFMAAPFALVRESPASYDAPDDEVEAELDKYDLLEIAKRVERWEAAERPKAALQSKPTSYRTPQSTVDAFWYVVSLKDP